jgi:hypothetical protein
MTCQPLPVPDVHEPSAIVLVEGESDRQAVMALAERRGRSLDDEGVAVVAMGGITNLAKHLARHEGSTVFGLYDSGEEGVVASSLALSGRTERADLERLGFYVCVEDLEDELIRAVGADRLVAVIEQQGEIGRFRRMQRQPAQRDRPLHAHLRVFLGNRKVRYGRLLIESLDLDEAPPPLEMLLSRL